jgi:DNA replication and repair protein RecF
VPGPVSRYISVRPSSVLPDAPRALTRIRERTRRRPIARVVRLAVRSFRNLADGDLALPPAGLVLVGPNGHGKTSFLEALLYLEVFRSFRGARESELVRFGADGFRVEAETDERTSGRADERTLEGTGRPSAGRRVVAAGYDARTRTKRVTVDGLAAERLAAAIGHVRGVVLSPFDVELVGGAPRERRRYLDVLLALTVPGYVTALAHYARALRQRARASVAEQPVWEGLMARSGAQVAAARQAWAATWAGRYREACVAMGERAEPGLTYEPGGPAEEGALAAALARGRDRDLATGRAGTGPHRDELRLTLDGRALRAFGSAGQQRTAAIGLRLVESAALAAACGAPPALCLDDAFAELDAERSARLGELVSGLSRAGGQVFATVPRDGEMPAAVEGLPRWTVRDGAMGPA